MLILSRRENEQIVFPTLGITIDLLKVRGSTARLGIDAPEDIPIVRDELLPRSFEMTPDGPALRETLQQLVRSVQQRLDAAAVHLNHLHRQFEDRELEDAQQTLLDLFQELKTLDRQAAEACEQEQATRRKRVLVVEDSVSENKMLTNLLRLWGAEVTTASNGRDALDFLSLHAAPDALIMGSALERYEESDFLGQLRSLDVDHSMKVIAVGDDAEGYSQETAETIGNLGRFDTWLPGPIDPQALQAALDLDSSTAA